MNGPNPAHQLQLPGSQNCPSQSAFGRRCLVIEHDNTLYALCEYLMKTGANSITHYKRAHVHFPVGNTEPFYDQV